MDHNTNRTLIFTGDGKGKTTAALGMALRASGHGMAVEIIQFIKADPNTGELAAIANMPGVEIVQAGLGFVPPQDDARFGGHRLAAEKALEIAREALQSGRYGLVILDEICTAVSLRLLDDGAVIDAVESAASGSCVVLTGRGATPGLIEMADTVTEMREIKHGMRAGWPAGKGVEF